VTADEGSGFDSLLQTKLVPPPSRPDLVERPRLLERLTTNLIGGRGFTRRLTVVAAPAGYGKSTLIAQWLPNLDARVGWLTLESEDNDPVRFLRYLIAALQRIDPHVGREAQAMLQSPQKSSDERVLTALINDLAADRESLVLVLDDYHAIQTVSIHDALIFLIEHLPGRLHLVIATREDPPLPSPRLEARGQALVVREADLAFRAEEAVKFFRQQMGLELNQDEAAALTRRTEGWVTGLQLAALSMRGVQDRAEFIRSFTGSNRFVLDYLFEEVFKQQSEEVRQFLLKTSVLDRFCGELCDAVTGGAASQDVIHRLERGHFFIVPLDQSRIWYRYHRLFRDLLLHRLQIDEGQLESRLHLRASLWFEEHGHPSEAIKHALAGEEWARAAQMIVQAQAAMLRNGEVTTLLAWCRQLPESLKFERPDLALTHAWALILIGKVQEASPILQSAKRMAGQSAQLQGEIAAAEAFIARTLGDMPRTAEFSRKALALLPEEDYIARANLSVNLGIMTWHMGELAETERLLREGLAGSVAAENHYVAHTAQVFLGRTLASRGHLGEAKMLYEQALRHSDRVPTASIAHHDLAALHLEWGSHSKSVEHIEQASEIALRNRNMEFQIACKIQLALINLCQGLLGAAGEALQAADALARDDDLPLLTRARRIACRAQLALARGDLQTARRWIGAMPAEHDAHTFYRFLDMNTARLSLAEGRTDQARRRLAEAFERAERSDWGYGLLAIRVFQALAAESRDVAVGFLSDALVRAEPEGYVRLFLGEGGALIPLLNEAARRGVTPDYVGGILAAHERLPAVTPTMTSELIEPLTERELEVLNLVAAGLSNREIANNLTISLGTAKTHVHNVYGKLGAGNRVQAVARARELNLI
jgi:LuxR family maltose regulon positive regulatory protein